MRHGISIVGQTFKLRPIGDSDAAAVIQLRSNPRLGRFLHPAATSVGAQLCWLEEYYNRNGDYYFVVERNDNGATEGLIAIYDVDSSVGSAEWGRWILKIDSLAAVESSWLIYRCCFEKLNLKRVYCRTIRDNYAVVSFHDSCGITDRRIIESHFKINQFVYDAIEHRVDQAAWSKIELRLEKLAKMLARRQMHERI